MERQIGVRDFMYVEIHIGHVIRLMRSGSECIVNDILWDMSELITRLWIAVGSSMLVDGVV